MQQIHEMPQSNHRPFRPHSQLKPIDLLDCNVKKHSTFWLLSLQANFIDMIPFDIMLNWRDYGYAN